MKVLVIGDTHFDNQFPGYLDAQLGTLVKIVKTSKPQAVIFLGDIFHHRNPVMIYKKICPKEWWAGYSLLNTG